MKKTSSFYQSEYWGKYQRGRGWLTYIYEGDNDQIYFYYKKFIFFYVIWIPGINCKLLEIANYALERFRQERDIKCYYARLSVLDLKHVSKSKYLLSKKWHESSVYIGSYNSFRLNIKKDIDTIIQECSGNWRHNYKRSLRKNLQYEIWENPDPVLMHEIIKSMEMVKDLTLGSSLNDLKYLMECLKGQILIFRAVSEAGITIAYRAAIITSEKIAWDFLAAANKEARKCYASYGLVMALLQHCQNVGVEYYDFSGVDKKKNIGVYNFKKGIGGDLIEYFGEYERGNLLLRMAINLITLFKKK
jgi:hypothetical protein